MINTICIVFLTDEGMAFLGHAIPPYVSKTSRGYSINCRTAQQVGTFMELTCDPGVTPNIKGRVVFSIPSHCIQLVVSAENKSDLGFATNGKHSA